MTFPISGTTRDKYKWAVKRLRQACDEALAELDLLPDEAIPDRLAGMIATVGLMVRLIRNIATHENARPDV